MTFVFDGEDDAYEYEMNVLYRHNVSNIACSAATRRICETAKQKQIPSKTFASGAHIAHRSAIFLFFSVDILRFDIYFISFYFEQINENTFWRKK